MARIKAHFDGRVIVPDEPVDFPPGQPLVVDVSVLNGPQKPNGASPPLNPDRFIRSFSAPVHPPEVYRREDLYRDDVFFSTPTSC